MTAPAIPSRDYRLATPQGELFARRWAGGAATPLVLFHDSLGSVELWRDFPAALAATTGRDVIAYDRIGFGRSAPYPGEWTFDFIRDEAAQGLAWLREALGLERYIGYGYSVGGAMAAAAAARDPAACVALVTQSTQAWVDATLLAGMREAEAAFAAPGQLERLARYHGDKAAWVLRVWLETWQDPAFAGWRIEQAAPAVDCPLLVLHGDRDEYGGPAHPRHIAGLGRAGARVALLPDCRHVPHREHPERVLAEVGAFLAGRP